MKKILVTGSTGLLGQYLVKKLVRKFEVRCIVRNKEKTNLLPTNVEIFVSDIVRKSDCNFAVKDVDVVCHLAAQMIEIGIPSKRYWEVNVVGTKNILEAAIKENVSHFIHCSSASIIGPVDKSRLDENYPYYDCSDIYKLTKMLAEKIVLNNKEKIPITIISSEFIYGPGCFHYFPLFKAIKEKKIFIVGKGDNLHQPVYVTDVVNTFLLSINNKKAIGEKFIIAGIENITSKELILKIMEKINLNYRLFHIPLWLARIASHILRIHPGAIDFFTKNHIYSISKAKKILGYEPKVNIDKGIENTVKWFEKAYLQFKSKL